MNVLGAIGTLMQGSGPDRILEEIYVENAGKHCWFCLKLMVLIADVPLYKSPHKWFVFTMLIL